MNWQSLKFENTYAGLPGAFYSRVLPTPAPNPYWVAYNPSVAALLGLGDGAQSEQTLRIVSGQELVPGFEPLAQVYAGHQFGHYVPRLGDGRAILLGEVCAPDGRKWDLHLKGAGLTPYSRQGDGRAVLRSCIREYLAGEALHALGIPTSRALGVVGSDEPVRREVTETRALLLRVAPSHVRFGTFEYFYYRGEWQRLAELLKYVLIHQDSDLLPVGQDLSVLEISPDLAELWLGRVVQKTARLMAAWQAVGFEHGVMNTDNFSVQGITLDFGPFGFMDDFDPSWICNHSDEAGRYAFDQQPAVGFWNCKCLVQALSPLLAPWREGKPLEGAEFDRERQERALRVLGLYEAEFHREYARRMRLKFGLAREQFSLPRESDADAQLMTRGLQVLAEGRGDYSLFFRGIASALRGNLGPILALFAQPQPVRLWLEAYLNRCSQEEVPASERAAAMDGVNPLYVLRNYLAQKAIDRAEKGDFSEVERLRTVLTEPFVEQPGKESDAAPAPDWGKKLEISCSS